MNSKLFGLFAFGVLALVLVISAVSAAASFVPASINQTIVQGQTSSVIGFQVNATTSHNLTFAVGSAFNQGSLALPASTTVSAGLSSFSATLSGIPANFTGTITGSISVSDGAVLATLPVSITVTSLCAFDAGVTANPGYLSVDIRDINVLEGFGEDENWLALDKVEIEVRVENNGVNNYDIDDVSLEWGIADDSLTNWVVEFDEIDEFNIKDDDENTLTVTFVVDEDDLDMNLDEIVGNDYNLVVRATGVIDDQDNLLTDDNTCASDSSDVSIDESSSVILTNFQIPETVSCGASVEVSANAWNIGNDQEDEVSVFVTNTELGLREDILLGDIDEFDNQQLSFILKVPANATEKTYPIKFGVYDEDGDLYEIGADDDAAEFFVPLKVSGNCAGTAAPVTVSASLVSGGKAGQDLVVKATITNTGSNSATYVLSSTEHGAWASSYTVEPSTLTLNAGQSGEATYTFKVNKDASGEQTFYVEALSGTQVTKQPVSVMIESSGFFSSITGGAIGDSGWVWGLGALNVLLIVVIIVVAMRVMRK